MASYVPADARWQSALRSGWLAAVPFLAGSAGMYIGGMLSDARVRRGEVARSVHLSQILGGMIASALFTLAVAHVRSTGMAVTCVSLALLCIHFAGTSAWGYVQAVTRGAVVSTVSSVQNFGSFVIASAAPLATGKLLDWTHSFQSASRSAVE